MEVLSLDAARDELSDTVKISFVDAYLRAFACIPTVIAEAISFEEQAYKIYNI